MDFKDVFKAPFTCDPGDYESYIWCGGKCVAYTLLKKEISKQVVALLNGEEGATPFNDVSYDAQHIKIGGEPILLVRGWGHLTGRLRINPSSARQIQTNFVEWTAKKLQGNE